MKPRLQVQARYESADLTTPLRDWGITQWERTFSEDSTFTANIRALVITRFRTEVRNNPLLNGLASKFASAIGSPTLRTRTEDKQYNTLADSAFYAWSKRVTPGADDADTLFASMKQIWWECLLAGEVFVVLLASGRIQLIQSEFCGSPSDKEFLNERNGIGRNADGTVKYYRFTKSGQSSSPNFSYTNTEIVDARNCIHIFDKDRIAMGRGLPWLLSSLPLAHDLIEIMRAKTKQIKDASSICGVIESESTKSAIEQLADEEGSTGGVDTVGIPGFNAPTQSPAVVDLRPGTFWPIGIGEKVNVLSSKYEAQDYSELVQLMLSAISAPVGLPVEIWFSGMGEVNFSGSKALGVQWADRRRDFIRFMEEKFLNRLHFWRVSRSRNTGLLGANPSGDDDLIKWAWKSAATLDPERDARANETRLRSGEASLADIWEEKDLFMEEVLLARKQLWDTARQIAGLPAEPAPIEWMLGSQSFQNQPAKPEPVEAPVPQKKKA